MDIWRASLCVLYESQGAMHCADIAREIKRRGLCNHSRSKQLSQTVAKTLRYDGHGHFTAKRNRFWLIDRGHSAKEYDRLRESFPHYFANSPREQNQTSDSERQLETLSRHQTRAKRELRDYQTANLQPQLIAEEVPSSFEGETKRITINAIERCQEARMACIRRHGYACMVCKMKFEDEYGSIGESYIHVHHLLPLSSGGARNTDPEVDLVPVCPNCHAMLHRGESKLGRPYEVEELRQMRRKARRRTIARQRRNRRR
jgi:hypothetical protein